MSIKRELLDGWGPGGWTFYQPETDWHAPGPLENKFHQQVKNIIAMRKANPRFNLPTDEAVVSAELEAYTEARWAKMYSKHGMKKFREEAPEDKKKESRFTRALLPPLRAAAGLAGIDTRSLEEWLGAGAKPVAGELANSRAAVCKDCEKGNQKHGWRELLTVPASAQLRRYIEGKHHLKLATPFDSELGSCTACKCVLELKVWQPIEFVKDNTDPAVFEKHREANPNCWVLRELCTGLATGRTPQEYENLMKSYDQQIVSGILPK